MNPRSALRLTFLGTLLATFACSTPISFEPQLDEAEVLDAGGADASPRDGEAGVRDSGGEASTPWRPDCDLYEASGCPREQPVSNTACPSARMPPGDTGSYCYYPAQSEGQLQVAECRRSRQASPTGMVWEVSPARCAYRCETDLPQGANFFSLLIDDCTARPVRDCRDPLARTSQEGVDLALRDFAIGCGLPATFRVGATFDARGCATWVHYPQGPRLSSAQVQCLSNRLEAVRFDCDVRCAINASAVP